MQGLAGVSSTVAAVILVAIGVALALAVTSYMTGIFSSAVESKPLLVIMPDSFINVSDVDNYWRRGPSLRLHVVNRGGDATVVKIVIQGVGAVVDRFYLVNESMSPREAYITTRGVTSRIIPAGSDVWVIAMLYEYEERPVPGGIYTVEVYTADGSVFSAMIPAKR